MTKQFTSKTVRMPRTERAILTRQERLAEILQREKRILLEVIPKIPPEMSIAFLRELLLELAKKTSPVVAIYLAAAIESCEVAEAELKNEGETT